MSGAMKLSGFKRRIFRGVSALAPLLSGGIWGAFWVSAAGGVDDIYPDSLRLLLAFAAGTLFRSFRNISSGKMWCWFIACISCVNWHCLEPMAFYFGLSRGVVKRRSSGNFIAGMAAGVLFGSCFPVSLGVMLTLTGISQLISSCREHRVVWSRQVKIIATVFNTAALVVSLFFAGLIYTGKVEVKMESDGEISPATWVSAAGLSEKKIPDILMISKKYPAAGSVIEAAAAEHVEVIHPGWMPKRKYDIVIIVDGSASMRAAPGRILNMLSADGVLVMPLELCALLPELPWRTMPGGGQRRFAAAVPDKKAPLEISGDKIEKNLHEIFRNSNSEYSKNILNGAISGVLIDFVSTAPLLPELPGRSDGSTEMLWGVAGILLLLEIFLHNRSGREYIVSIISAAIYGLSCGILAGNNEIYQSTGGGIVFYLLAVLPLWCKLPLNGIALRIISVLAGGALWGWYLMPCTYSALAALVLAGLNFSGSRSRFQTVRRSSLEWQDALTFAALAGAFWLGGTMHNAVMMVLLVICTLKFWLQIKS